MKKLAFAIACFSLQSVSAGKSEPLAGNDLLSACKEKGDMAQSGFCIGYLIGVVEGLRFGATVPIFAAQTGSTVKEVGDMADNLLGFCPPHDAQYSQHLDIVVNYLTKHPESRHESARTLVFSSLEEAFPCPQNDSSLP